MSKKVYNLIIRVINDVETECNTSKNKLEDIEKKKIIKDVLFNLHEIRRNIKKGFNNVK